eukprot:950122-Pyramimonas_sp.AAC.1
MNSTAPHGKSHHTWKGAKGNQRRIDYTLMGSEHSQTTTGVRATLEIETMKKSIEEKTRQPPRRPEKTTHQYK